MPSILPDTAPSEPKLFVYRERAGVTLACEQDVYGCPGYTYDSEASWNETLPPQQMWAGFPVVPFLVHADLNGGTVTCNLRFPTQIYGIIGGAARFAIDH